jgi:hypothetical protein
MALVCNLNYSDTCIVHWNWKDHDVGLMIQSGLHLPLALEGLASLFLFTSACVAMAILQVLNQKIKF